MTFNTKHQEALFRACRTGEIEEVNYYINTYPIAVPINAYNLSGNTALIQACDSKRLEVVIYLLENGAEVNKRHERTGQTALHVAASAYSLTIIQTLLKYGSDPTLIDENGKTALDYVEVQLTIFKAKTNQGPTTKNTIANYEKVKSYLQNAEVEFTAKPRPARMLTTAELSELMNEGVELATQSGCAIIINVDGKIQIQPPSMHLT